MKHNILFILLLYSFLSVPAQISSKIQLTGAVVNSFSPHYKASKIALAGGVVYEFGWEKSGIFFNVGANYLPISLRATQFECPFEPWFCDFPKSYTNTFYLVEVPFLLKKRIFQPNAQKWEVSLLGGYSVGKILDKAEIIVSKTNEKTVQPFNLTDLITTVHFFNVGISANYILSPKLTLSLSNTYKLTNIYDERYSYISSFYAQVGISRHIGKCLK